MAADRRGIPSHGVNRAEFYCRELSGGLVDGAAGPALQTEGPSFAVVDGRNALGAVVARFAMQVPPPVPARIQMPAVCAVCCCLLLLECCQ